MSYKALLNATKATTAMYNNFVANNINNSHASVSNTLAGGMYENGDEDEHEHDESIHSDDQDDYHNGDGDGATPERQGSEDHGAASGNGNGNGQEGFSNFSLKRCRFSPRQDIALMKEVFAAEDKPYEHVGKAAWDAWAKIAHVLNQKQVSAAVGFF